MRRELSTERLLLRAPRPGDAPAVFDGWMQDPRVLRYLAFAPHVRVEQTRALLDWEQARWLKRSAWTWLLVPHAGGTPVGLVQLLPQSFEAPVHHLRLGYLLARPAWGRGWMREAIAAVLAEAFAQPGTWRVDALCDVDNAASLRLLQALHFEHEGVLRRHTVHPNVGPLPRDVAILAHVVAGPTLA